MNCKHATQPSIFTGLLVIIKTKWVILCYAFKVYTHFNSVSVCTEKKKWDVVTLKAQTVWVSLLLMQWLLYSNTVKEITVIIDAFITLATTPMHQTCATAALTGWGAKKREQRSSLWNDVLWTSGFCWVCRNNLSWFQRWTSFNKSPVVEYGCVWVCVTYPGHCSWWLLLQLWSEVLAGWNGIRISLCCCSPPTF